MPWTNNGCGATAEFVELMNFGPGPVNIGCYILTDGDFSVTIPPNTILQPGQFYVIAGQNSLPAGCGNIDSTVMVHLNWTTCGCTSGTIPTTGEGWFTDGGTANEQIVLLDPNLAIIDAVVRSLPAEPSSLITTSSIGGCPSRTFDLDLMPINYETLGMSTGRGNSFARTLDGDCGWVKDNKQSANASNNRGGDDPSEISYDLFITNSMDCHGTGGGVEIYVKYGDYESIFPMNYTFVIDTDNNGVFDFNDQYVYGVDSTEPSVAINGLPSGSYRLAIASVKGCYLFSFDFSILPCFYLPLQLQSFKLLNSQNNTHTFEWVLSEVEDLKEVIIEKSIESSVFVTDKMILGESNQSGTKKYVSDVSIESQYRFYRLKITSKNNKIFYSPIINTAYSMSYANHHVWPNPAKDVLNVQVTSPVNQKASYKIFGINNTVAEGKIKLTPGHNNFPLSINTLPAGVYHLVVYAENNTAQPITFRFVKQP